MTTPVLICDDSGMARKQLARALPEDWDIQIEFAADGEECLAKIRQGSGDLLFLDLNMPGLDGYGVLEAINREDLPTMTVVVSGDVQPEARARVKKLGAIDFIRKPCSPDDLLDLLLDYGLYSTAEADAPGTPVPQRPSLSGPESLPAVGDWKDVLQELSNVAMGRAGDLLAQLLKVFIKLPIPRVNMLAPSELKMALAVAEESGAWSGVCQGFVGSGIAGEALLLFSDSRFGDVAQLLGYEGEIDASTETEVLMDLSSIMVGAFLNGLGEQLDISFGISHPSVLGKHLMIGDLLENNGSRWSRMLSIELNYALEHYEVRCDLLLLFAEESIDALQERISFVTELPDE